MVSLHVPYKLIFIAHFFYSLFIHIVVLFVILNIPISGSGFHLSQFAGFFVSLTEEMKVKPSISIKKVNNKLPIDLEAPINLEEGSRPKSNLIEGNDVSIVNDSIYEPQEWDYDIKHDIKDGAMDFQPITASEDAIIPEVLLIEEGEKKENDQGMIELLSKLEKDNKIEDNPIKETERKTESLKIEDSDPIKHRVIEVKNEIKQGYVNKLKDTSSDESKIASLSEKIDTPMLMPKEPQIPILPDMALNKKRDSDLRIEEVKAPLLPDSRENKHLILDKQKGIDEKKSEQADIAGIGIPIPDIFILKDIRIELIFYEIEKPAISTSLFKKAHPKERAKENDKKLEIKEVGEYVKGRGYKIEYYLLNAEKGTYTFVIENKDKKTYHADAVFYIYQEKSGERIRKYADIMIKNDDVKKIKFILPEAVFWDDEDYFSGSIEDARSVTKFNYNTGLSWKEDKDY